jgi:hypothetical protein
VVRGRCRNWADRRDAPAERDTERTAKLGANFDDRAEAAENEEDEKEEDDREQRRCLSAHEFRENEEKKGENFDREREETREKRWNLADEGGQERHWTVTIRGTGACSVLIAGKRKLEMEKKSIIVFFCEIDCRPESDDVILGFCDHRIRRGVNLENLLKIYQEILTTKVRRD